MKGAATRSGRERLIRLGQSGPAREFVEAALAPGALGEAGLDGVMRYLLAKNFAQLGFRSAAEELLGQLGEAERAHPDVRALTAEVERLANDRRDSRQREETLRRNVAALVERGALGEAEAALVKGSGAAAELFIGVGGATLRRAAGAGIGEWRLAFSARPEIAPTTEVPPPLVVAGLESAAFVAAVVEATPDAGEGDAGLKFGQRLLFVDDDVQRIGAALEMGDIGAVIGLERTEWFLGAGAVEKLGTYLAERLECALPERCVHQGRGALVERVGAAMRAAQERQLAALERWKGRATAVYAGRGRECWAERFGSIVKSAAGAKPRVLIPTCRYSTFVKHSAGDIAAAFERCGWEARLLIEPDSQSRLASTAYWRAFAEFEPDLVVSINFPRASLGAVTPANVPLVCWVQDAMSHLFDAKVGAAQGALDFLVGHVHPELVREFGFPESRALTTPVLVNERKFHDGPVSDRARFECEVAYVSHQSETAESWRDRLMAGYAGRSPALARATGAMYEEVVRIATGGLERAMAPALEGAARAALRAALGREPDAGEVAEAVNGAARPMAERAMRHQMLEWAAEVCRERGWRLHIYGKGWAGHATLGAHAKGELGHGEELRAAYQCARVHLHAGLGAVHQRVMECAMSGGATLVRWKRDDEDLLEWWAQETVAATGPALESYEPFAPGLRCFVRCADHWAFMLTTGLRARLGRPDPYLGLDLRYVDPSIAGRPWGCRNGEAVSFEEAFFAGDPAEAGFWSRESFAAAVERAVRLPRFRDGLSAWQRECAGRRFTYQRFCERLVRRIGVSLWGEAAARGLAA